eukprot:6777978-Pyramimonas_sp.AAC.1
MARLREEVKALRAASKDKGQLSEAAKATEEDDADEAQRKAHAEFDDELLSLCCTPSPSQLVKNTVGRLDGQNFKL